MDPVNGVESGLIEVMDGVVSVLDSNQAEDIDYYSGQAEKRYTAEEMCYHFGNLSFGDSN